MALRETQADSTRRTPGQRNDQDVGGEWPHLPDLPGGDPRARSRFHGDLYAAEDLLQPLESAADCAVAPLEGCDGVAGGTAEVCERLIEQIGAGERLA